MPREGRAEGIRLNFSLRQKISSWGKLAELILFPSFCELCSSFLEFPEERVICRSCWESIKPFYSSCCLSCGRFFEGRGEPHFCLKCLEEKPPFSCHRSFGRYSGKLKDLILFYKFNDFWIIGKDLARLVHKTLVKKEEIWLGLEIIIPVPLHPKRERKRGFNQAQVIAKELANLEKVKLVEGVLVKTKNVPPQTFLQLKERENNVRGAFQVVKKEKIRNRVILLVDDVYTTGSTIRECSLVLKKAGAKEVRALTIAQA